MWPIAAAALAALCGLACPAGICAGAFAGGWTMVAAPLLAVLVLVVAAPCLVYAVRRGLSMVAGASSGQLDTLARALSCSHAALVPVMPLPPLPPTDEELCRAWCASYRSLERTPSPQKRIRIVEERGRHLDELERRHPAAITAWLMSGATAAGDPLPYLDAAEVDIPVINWDELVGGQD